MLYIWKLSSILCRFEDNKTLFVTCWGLWKCRTWAAGNTSIPPSMIRSLTGHRLPYSVRASRITRTFGVVPCGTTFVCWLFWGYGWLIFGVVGWGKVRGHYWLPPIANRACCRVIKNIHLIDIFSLPTGYPLMKLGEFGPLLPPSDRMKFFWAVKSSIPLRQPKKRNSQAWLLKKIFM